MAALQERESIWRADVGGSPGYKLKKVVVIHRHGARTGVLRLEGEDYQRLYGPCEGAAFDGMDGGEKKKEKKKGRKSTARLDTAGIATAECSRGMLTMLGGQQMEDLGKSLRSRYNHWLPAAYDPERVFLRSTDVPRTITSLRHLVQGLFPGVRSEEAPIYVEARTKEILFPHTHGCERLAELFYERKTELGKSLPPYAAEGHDDELSRRNASWVYISDIGKCRRAHGQDLPEGMDEAFMDNAKKHATTTLNHLVKGDTVRLGIGRFVGTVLKDLESDSATQLYIYSGHDTTVVPLLHALHGSGDDVHIPWPPFASHIELELLEKVAEPEKENMYVRMYYNDKVVGIAPLAALKESLRPVLLEDAEYEQECIRHGKEEPSRHSW